MAKEFFRSFTSLIGDCVCESRVRMCFSIRCRCRCRCRCRLHPTLASSRQYVSITLSIRLTRLSLSFFLSRCRRLCHRFHIDD